MTFLALFAAVTERHVSTPACAVGAICRRMANMQFVTARNTRVHCVKVRGVTGIGLKAAAIVAIHME